MWSFIHDGISICGVLGSGQKNSHSIIVGMRSFRACILPPGFYLHK